MKIKKALFTMALTMSTLLTINITGLPSKLNSNYQSNSINIQAKRRHHSYKYHRHAYIRRNTHKRHHYTSHKRYSSKKRRYEHRRAIAKHKAALKRIKQQRLNKSIVAKNKRVMAHKLANIKALFSKIKQGRLNQQDLANIRNRQIMDQQLAESKAALNNLKQKQQAQQNAETARNNQMIQQRQNALLAALEQFNQQKSSESQSQENYKVPFRKINSGNTDSESTHESTPEHNETEIKSRSFDDINQDRAAYGLAPYQESTELDQIANMRAKQNADNPNNPDPHIDPKTGNYFVYEDAQALGDRIYPAENCAFANTGEQYDANGDDVVLHNGYQMADDDENSMVNHDMSAGNNNGHRNNILSPYMHQVGIGVAHNNYYDAYCLVEDFSD